MSYGDLVVEVFEGFMVDVISYYCLNLVMSKVDKKWYGVQFYLEVCYFEYGNDFLKNFVFGVCDCEGKWLMENFIEIEM